MPSPIVNELLGFAFVGQQVVLVVNTPHQPFANQNPTKPHAKHLHVRANVVAVVKLEYHRLAPMLSWTHWTLDGLKLFKSII